LRGLRGDRGAKRIPPMCFLAAPYRRRPPHEVNMGPPEKNVLHRGSDMEGPISAVKKGNRAFGAGRVDWLFKSCQPDIQK
jgi:hypothetical protein